MRLPTGQISRFGTLKTLLQRFAFLSLIGATFALMLIGKADTILVERARDAVADAVTPVLRVMSEPAAVVSDFVNNLRELAAIREENAELREENARLLQWQSVAQKLESENKSLRSLTTLVPEPNATFVTALYSTFLSRTPDDFGLSSWLNVLHDPSQRHNVASGISNSNENRTAIVTHFYQTYLHRTPDSGGLGFWKNQLAGGLSQPQIISFFVTSTEYLSFNHIG